MNEIHARSVASILNGKAHHTGGGFWVVQFHRNDGSIAVLDEDGMIEYADQAAYDDGMESAVILYQFAD